MPTHYSCRIESLTYGILTSNVLYLNFEPLSIGMWGGARFDSMPTFSQRAPTPIFAVATLGNPPPKITSWKMSEASISEASLKASLVERLKAIHVEITDISGMSILPSRIAGFVRSLRHFTFPAASFLFFSFSPFIPLPPTTTCKVSI